MKAFFSSSYFRALAAALALAPLSGLTAEDPKISGPLVELRKAPLFAAEPLPLARTWGPALPMGTGFQVEKVYGRWIYGRPVPPANMKPADFAPSGWVYTRSLLLPNDANTASATALKNSRSLLFHARAAWKKLGLGAEPLRPSLDFLENLTLSRQTLAAFSRPEEGSGAGFEWIPRARAAEEQAPAPLGLTGTDLNFLEQEIKVVQNKKKIEARQRELRRLKIPEPPPLDDKIRRGILGRYMLERYLELPALSLEEVDGSIYMRATAMRALHGCPKKIQDYWRDRRWNFFRVFRLKSRTQIKHPWFEIALPGGYFAVSGKAIELASNEAELAYLLVRQLVRELHVKRATPNFDKKSWPESLQAHSEVIWDQVLKAQSTKDADNIDVSNEIAIDTQAVECISRAGYRPLAAVAYLKKLVLHKDEPWAEWFTTNSIGLDYRLERVRAITEESVAQQKFPAGRDSQQKRFASAAKQWNLLP